MSELHEVGRIQINEDLEFLRKEWRIQRIGWIVMLLTLLLGLAGAFGRGPLAAADAGNRDTLAVSYDRIVRHGAETEVRITAGPRLHSDTLLRIFISADYLHATHVMDVIPEPVASGTKGEFVYYDFQRLDPGTSSEIVLHLNAISYWSTGARIFAHGARPVDFDQVILP